MVREKYGEIAQNPPHFPGRLFTGVQPFSFKIPKFCFGCKFPNLIQGKFLKFLHHLNVENKLNYQSPFIPDKNGDLWLFKLC